MNAPRATRRPPGVVLGWVAVIAVTVGLGIVGRAGDGTPVQASAEWLASPVAVGSPSALNLPARALSRPVATRPPIGEDGVMGGLVFGTAWGWLGTVGPER